ncbi:EpsG family protein [Clostridium botulinum]|nr:EpsG family protein [Clostridium botulinum]
MAIYVLVFILSLIFINIGQKLESYKNYVLGKICYIIAILLPTMLAGFRDYNIGTDVNVYAVPMFNDAIRYINLADYLLHSSQAIFSEPLYGTMNFIISRFTINPFWILFSISLIINSFTFLGCYKYKNKIKLWFLMFLFYFTFYNLSLNMMRQSIAISIIFYATNFIFEKKINKYYLWVIVAIGFHTSGIIAIVFYPFYQYINTKFAFKYRKIINPMIIFSMIFFILLINPITNYLVSIGFIRENYNNYLNGSVFGSGFNFKFFILSVIEMILIFCPKRYIKTVSFQYNYLVLMSVIGFVLSQLTFISIYIVRIAYYFLFVRMYVYGLIVYLSPKKRKFILLLLIVIYFVIYWIYVYCYCGLNETVPYKMYLK